MNLVIREISFEAEMFNAILMEAENEGGAFILRLRDEWLSGATRFDRRGEILFGAFSGAELVGVGGITHDPYAPAPGLGRVRHVYVLKRHRGRGVGRRLMEHILNFARDRFTTLRLTTRQAGRFYEGFGFIRCEAPHQTHRLAL